MACMDKEAVFIRMIEDGELEIDLEGNIWRLKKRHGRGVKRGGGYNRGSTTSPCRRVRAEYPSHSGYLLIAATFKGRRTVTGAHRVVWSYSNKRPIPAGLTINHKHENGDKKNNRPDNLELATYSEQRKHALEVLKVNRSRPKGSLHPKTHLLEKDVLQIRRMRMRGKMVKDIAVKYKMSPKAISAICCRRTWLHI